MIPVLLPDVPDSKDGDPSFIHDIVPITLDNPCVPILFSSDGMATVQSHLLFKFCPIEAGNMPIGHRINSLDRPDIPLLPANFALAAFNSYGPGLFIADHGLDVHPYPGAQNVLLLPTPDGRLTNATALLPQVHGFWHGVSAGSIDDTGRPAVFFNSLWSQPGTPPQLLTRDARGGFEDISHQLPSLLKQPTRSYTTSLFTDVKGSGRMDLVLGTADSQLGPSLIFPNPGNGDFSQVAPLILPSSPLSPVPQPSGNKPRGAIIQAILPIRWPDSGCTHLVVVSTRGDYNAYAVQLFVNDGTGNFVDETTKRFAAPIMGTGGWIKRVHVADLTGNGTPAIITQPCMGAGSPPSQIYLGDHRGSFALHQTIPHRQGSVYGVAAINGSPTFIICNGYDILLKPVHYPHRRARPPNSHPHRT